MGDSWGLNEKHGTTQIEILEYQTEKAFDHTDRVEQRLLSMIKNLESELEKLKSEVKELHAQNEISATTGAREV